MKLSKTKTLKQDFSFLSLKCSKILGYIINNNSIDDQIIKDTFFELNCIFENHGCTEQGEHIDLVNSCGNSDLEADIIDNFYSYCCDHLGL